jgi:hypothetical protein
MKEPSVTDRTTVEQLDIVAAAIAKTRVSFVERLISAPSADHDRLAGNIAGLERALGIIAENRRNFIDGTVLDGDDTDEVKVHVL